MNRIQQSMKAAFAPLAALVDLVRTAPSCGGDCFGGRRPCNCRPAAARAAAAKIAQGPARCIACGEPQGEPHVAGCWVEQVTIGRNQ